MKLVKAYGTVLERPARNMVHGSFGGGYGHAQFCVQTMDGQFIIIDLVIDAAAISSTVP